MALFRIDGMTCDGCARALRKAVERRSPALALDIDPVRGLVTAPAEAEPVLQAAAAEAGFVYRGPMAEPR